MLIDKFHSLLWKHNIHYRVHRGPPLAPLPVQMSAFQDL
jgi:hypothetical protein